MYWTPFPTNLSQLLRNIGSISQEQILGIGRTGLVVRQGELAIELSLKWSTSSDEEVKANIESLQHEQSIYTCLGKCDGVVPFLSFSETATTLRVMENGDLRSYLRQNRPPKHLQLSWLRAMARTLAYIHERRVIVADIASRNFLLDSGLSIKFCDFTESIAPPLDTCMEKADFGGCSIRTDIGQLGSFDIFKDIPPKLSRGRWPRREDLPSTQGVWLGLIIDECWTESAINTALDLCQELENAEIENEPDEILRPSSNLLSMIQRTGIPGDDRQYR
ncbi:serine/threonine protein kinase [Aspergillus avenaceus]|uniref:Serine/threonine protein kinase n=1 Tax=Aspergillus avenaceus TaxID=36643 RepID=A0A5N6U283_ASPAV|nr:serine/threonine protein kinase [Aspergillus avenaceus]